MNENNDNKPVTQNDFKSELKFLRLEFKKEIYGQGDTAHTDDKNNCLIGDLSV